MLKRERNGKKSMCGSGLDEIRILDFFYNVCANTQNNSTSLQSSHYTLLFLKFHIFSSC